MTRLVAISFFCTIGYWIVLATQDCSSLYPPFEEWNQRVRELSLMLGLENLPLAITRPPFAGTAKLELKCIAGLLNHAFVVGIPFAVATSAPYWLLSSRDKAGIARRVIARYSASSSPASQEKLVRMFGILMLLFGIGTVWVWIEGGPRDALLRGVPEMLVLQTIGPAFAGCCIVGGIRSLQAASEMRNTAPTSICADQ